jgi:hypothetical protein
MLGPIDLRDWAEDADVVRAEIRLLPVVQRIASDPSIIQKTLGNDLALRWQAFNEGRNLDVESLRRLFAELVLIDRSPTLEATIDKISHVEWFFS